MHLSDGFRVVPLFLWSNLNFLLNSQRITFPIHSLLVLYSLCANLLHSLIMWLIVSSLSLHNLHLLFCCVLSILVLHRLYGIVLCYYQKRFSFSLKVSLFLAMSKFFRERFRLFVAWNVNIVVFFPFLFPGYFYSVDICVVCKFLLTVISLPPCCFYVIFLSLYRCIDAALNARKSSFTFFSWHVHSVYVFSGM